MWGTAVVALCVQVPCSVCASPGWHVWVAGFVAGVLVSMVLAVLTAVPVLVLVVVVGVVVPVATEAGVVCVVA